MRLRPVAILLAAVALDYAVWNSSLAGGSDVAGMISGLTLPPLIAALLVLMAVNAVRGVGDATRRRPKRQSGATGSAAAAQNKPATKRTNGDVPAGAGAPAIMGHDTEEQAAAASSRASSPKIAA